MLELLQHDLNDGTESLHLLLDGSAHASVGKTDRVGHVDRHLELSGEELGNARGKLEAGLMGVKCCAQGLCIVVALPG